VGASSSIVGDSARGLDLLDADLGRARLMTG
jgi:hypothetical protein